MQEPTCGNSHQIDGDKNSTVEEVNCCGHAPTWLLSLNHYFYHHSLKGSSNSLSLRWSTSLKWSSIEFLQYASFRLVVFNIYDLWLLWSPSMIPLIYIFYFFVSLWSLWFTSSIFSVSYAPLSICILCTFQYLSLLHFTIFIWKWKLNHMVHLNKMLRKVKP